MSAFVVNYKMLDLTAEIEIAGAVDEKFKFESIPSTIRTVVINLEKIDYISSFGVKLWVQWIAQLPRDASLVLVKARPMLIANVNTVEGFTLPKTTVESVLVPFTTDDGEESVDVVLVQGKDFFSDGKMKFPEVKAGTGEAMVPDFIPERFFKFLKR